MDEPQEEPGRAGKWLIGGVVACLLGAAIYSGILEARRARLVGSGAPSPQVTFERLGGGTVSMEALRGKVVMLDFWATWCPPCVEEMPTLVKLADEYQARGLVFVAANRDDPEQAKAAVGVFAARSVPGLERYAVFADDAATEPFQVHALPTLYFIDRQGRVIDAQAGSASESTLRQWIEKALATP